MRGLLIKDFFLLKKYLKLYTIIILFYLLIGGSTGNFAFSSSVVIFLCIGILMTSFSYDELTKWDRYAVSLPLSRKMIVKSRYVLNLFLIFIGFIVSLVIALGMILFYQNGSFFEIIMQLISCTSIALVLSSIFLPLIYAFGVEKTRILLFVILFLPFVLTIFLSKLQPNLFATPLSEALVIRMILFSPLLGFLCQTVSYFISCKIYERKEF